jgi:hypothetical protein
MHSGAKDAVTCDSLRNGNEEKEECNESDDAPHRHERESSQDSSDMFAGLFTAFVE